MSPEETTLRTFQKQMRELDDRFRRQTTKLSIANTQLIMKAGLAVLGEKKSEKLLADPDFIPSNWGLDSDDNE